MKNKEFTISNLLADDEKIISNHLSQGDKACRWLMAKISNKQASKLQNHCQRPWLLGPELHLGWRLRKSHIQSTQWRRAGRCLQSDQSSSSRPDNCNVLIIGFGVEVNMCSLIGLCNYDLTITMNYTFDTWQSEVIFKIGVLWIQHNNYTSTGAGKQRINRENSEHSDARASWEVT